MLSESAALGLNTHVRRPDAVLCVNIVPYETVYWEDEWPREDLVLTLAERDAVKKMFWFRKKMWDGLFLEPDEQQAWEEMKAQAPNWALFRRVKLTREQRIARRKVERCVKRELDAFERGMELDEEQCECLRSLEQHEYWRLMDMDDSTFQRAMALKLERSRKQRGEQSGGAPQRTAERRQKQHWLSRIANRVTKWVSRDTGHLESASFPSRQIDEEQIAEDGD